MEVSPPLRRRAVRPIETRILALDLSLTCTGWGLIVGGSLIKRGHLTSKHKGIARLYDLRHQLFNVAEETDPNHWAVEGYSFGSKNTRAHSIGEWGGAAKMQLEEWMPGHGYILSPSTIKQFVTGNGNAPKSQIPLALFKLYGLDIDHEDEADAVAIGMATHAYLQGPNQTGLLAYQRDALGWGKSKKKVTPVERAG